jgi:hypothetical protein
MRIITIEGKAKLLIGKRLVSVVQGSQYTAPVNENLEITEPDQGQVTPYQAQDLESLPVTVLDRPVTVHEPMTPAQVDVAAKALDPNALTWVIVGDLAKIEKPVRALNFGEVTVLDTDGKPIAK